MVCSPDRYAFWVDTHAHLDDDRYTDPMAVRREAQAQQVRMVVIPGVVPAHFERVRQLAHQCGDAYALGIHPMYIPDDLPAALAQLEQALAQHQHDPHLVAVGEIGMDLFEPHLCTPQARARQEVCLRAQLRLARQYQLPVLLHVRKSVDQVVAHLRQITPCGGIAHAFVGSAQQAQALIALGCKLGFGGAMTFDRATRLRGLAASLPLESIVLETDAPDIVPSWLYATQAQRNQGQPQNLNTPAQIPQIGQVLAALRGESLEHIQHHTTVNALRVLPRLLNLPANS